MVIDSAERMQNKSKEMVIDIWDSAERMQNKILSQRRVRNCDIITWPGNLDQLKVDHFHSEKLTQQEVEKQKSLAKNRNIELWQRRMVYSATMAPVNHP